MPYIRAAGHARHRTRRAPRPARSRSASPCRALPARAPGRNAATAARGLNVERNRRRSPAKWKAAVDAGRARSRVVTLTVSQLAGGAALENVVGVDELHGRIDALEQLLRDLSTVGGSVFEAHFYFLALLARWMARPAGVLRPRRRGPARPGLWWSFVGLARPICPVWARGVERNRSQANE